MHFNMISMYLLNKHFSVYFLKQILTIFRETIGGIFGLTTNHDYLFSFLRQIRMT